MRRRGLSTLAILLALHLGAVPAAAQVDDYAITGGTVVTVTGPVYENGTVLIRDGRIAAVGTDIQVPAGIERIDAAGRYVYPGLIDAGTGVGLSEAGGMAGAQDRFELGEYNPHIEAYVGVHQASEVLGAQRVGGITSVITGLTSGTISGYDSLINLWGWTPQAMAVRERAGLRLNWPRGGSNGMSRQDRIEELRRLFREARVYPDRLEKYRAGDLPGFQRDLRLDGLTAAARGEVLVFIEASSERDIREAVSFAEEMGLEYVIRGAADAWRMLGFLKEHGVRILYSDVHSVPDREEPYDLGYALPALLYQEGIEFAIYSEDTAHVFALPYLAGMAVGYGLPLEEALKAVTIYPARILGVAEEMGSIEEGKLANLIITTGNPVEYTTQVETMFIRGERIPWDDKFSRLYRKYLGRPGEDRP